jgi:hypothetical protein
MEPIVDHLDIQTSVENVEMECDVVPDEHYTEDTLYDDRDDKTITVQERAERLNVIYQNYNIYHALYVYSNEEELKELMNILDAEDFPLYTRMHFISAEKVDNFLDRIYSLNEMFVGPEDIFEEVLWNGDLGFAVKDIVNIGGISWSQISVIVSVDEGADNVTKELFDSGFVPANVFTVYL